MTKTSCAKALNVLGTQQPANNAAICLVRRADCKIICKSHVCIERCAQTPVYPALHVHSCQIVVCIIQH
jgi:hypothetical protein